MAGTFSLRDSLNPSVGGPKSFRHREAVVVLWNPRRCRLGGQTTNTLPVLYFQLSPANSATYYLFCMYPHQINPPTYRYLPSTHRDPGTLMVSCSQYIPQNTTGCKEGLSRVYFDQQNPEPGHREYQPLIVLPTKCHGNLWSRLDPRLSYATMLQPPTSSRYLSNGIFAPERVRNIAASTIQTARATSRPLRALPTLFQPDDIDPPWACVL
jgi:hypothetical protein